MQDDHLKKCGGCGQMLTVDDFLTNPELVPVGMMFVDGDTTMAFYMFQHEATCCHSSLLVPVNAFQSLLKEPPPEKILALSECCELHCVSLSDLAACKQPCHFAPFRRFLLAMMEHRCEAKPSDTDGMTSVGQSQPKDQTHT